ncbi:MAG: 4'-phosphopantetheinyl transferase superfamily protein [Propionibacteriaceae bacterium]|jgi:3-oxoacyl-(acyl-carrier-protein) synthase/phosphopantetheinyl transferase|nr:4'-phosphopantetheinyl transferase superfamily protein [Propionibacteriaceae bacterium]
MTTPVQDIAIVGLSLACPGAQTVGEFWRNLRDGVDSIVDTPEEVIEEAYFNASQAGQPDRFVCRKGGFTQSGIVDSMRFGVLPVVAEGADPDQLLSLMLTEQALHDADVLERGLPLQNAAVIIGRGNFAGAPQLRATEIVRMAEQFTGLIGHALPELTEAQLERIRRGYQKLHGRYRGDTATATMPSLVASVVAHHFDMHGPACVVDAACASGIVALQQGAQLLTSGECDLAVIGGMHTPHSSVFWSAFNLMGALSRNQRIAPFSAEADGLLIGQGAGFMVIKTLERAVADQDRIYAVVKGIAVGSDGGGHSLLTTDVEGQSRVLRRAWRQSGLDPADVSYIEAHGTGTPVGDATEIETLTQVFGDQSARRAYLGSVKSNIGHLMPAAGAMGLIKTALALFHRQIPPTLHCQRPRSELLRSRFEAVSEVVDWEAAGLPLIAGVDAFGFGGINAHAVLTAYEEPPRQRARYRAARRRHDALAVYAFAAPDQAGLLAKIDFRANPSRVGGWLGQDSDRYRLVVFDPTPERMDQAIEIVRRDQPWLGRGDIWFTNQPLLADGGQMAFMFPGWNDNVPVEHESVEDELGLVWSGREVEDDELGYHRRSMDLFSASQFIDQALRTTGVEADLYTGHSVGEWHAARACGMLDQSFDQSNTDFSDKYFGAVSLSELPDCHLLAVSGGLTPAQWDALVESIPGVYLPNDNCPSQKVLCVLPPALDQLTARLTAAGCRFQTLPWSTIIHTSLMEPFKDYSSEAMGGVAVHPGRVPLWSAITLAPVAADGRDAAEVFGSELRRPVRFRQLIERLYDEGVRVFVQVGVGTLPGFVDDTLRDRPHVALPSLSPRRPAIEQLRRVHAMLYVMGGAADLDFMGMGPIHRSLKSAHLLPRGYPLMVKLDELDEILAGFGPKTDGSGAASPGGVPSADRTLIAVPAEADPALRALDDNVRAALDGQEQVVQAWRGTPVAAARRVIAPRGFSRGLAAGWLAPPPDQVRATGPQRPLAASAYPAPPTAATAQPVPPPAVPSPVVPSPAVPSVAPTAAATGPAPSAPAASPTVPPRRAGSRFEVPLHLSVDDYPFLIDHSLVNQPVGWPISGDLLTVVPLTMSLELLAEIAAAQAPELKVVKLGSILATEFIQVNQPWDGVVKGLWKSENLIGLSLPGKLMLDVTLAEDYPEAPSDFVERAKTDIGPPDLEPLGREEQYTTYAFHRSRYWSMMRTEVSGEHGFHNIVQAQEGKGSLLDQMGQAIGLYLHLHAENDRISFPVRVGSVTFYQDRTDQSGLFDHYCVIRKVTDNFIIGDCVYTRDGRVWAIARDWVNQRVGTDNAVWGVLNTPWRELIATPIADNVHYFASATPNRQNMIFCFMRYLTQREKKEGLEVTNDALRADYLAGRIALKDAVRHFLRRPGGPLMYPIEIDTHYDDSGKLFVKGNCQELERPVQVSLAHKHGRAVAVVSDQPVGVDIEAVEPKSEGFRRQAFSAGELALLEAAPDLDEWVIRFWCAKEAYGKMLGVGLAFDPKRHQIERVDGEDVFIAGRRIRTVRQDEGYAVAWTMDGDHR